MAHAALARPTVDDYLAFEAERVGQKPNYEWDGQTLIEMAGVSPSHAHIQFNLNRVLSPALYAEGYAVYGSDLRLSIGSTRYRYPDLSATRFPPEFTSERPPSLLNPTLLVEVLSRSTAHTDLKDKLDEYRRIPSLAEYWIVDSESVFVLRYDCSGPALIAHPYRDLEVTFESEALGVTVRMAEVYRDVTFDEPAGGGSDEGEGRNA